MRLFLKTFDKIKTKFEISPIFNIALEKSLFIMFLQLFLQTNYQSKKKHTMLSAPTWTQHSPKWLDFKKKRNLFKILYQIPCPDILYPQISFCYKIHFQPNKNYTHFDKFTNNLLEFFHFLKVVLFFENFLKLVFEFFDHCF